MECGAACPTIFIATGTGGKKCLDKQEGTKVLPNLSLRACIQNQSLQTIHTLNNCFLCGPSFGVETKVLAFVAAPQAAF